MTSRDRSNSPSPWQLMITTSLTITDAPQDSPPSSTATPNILENVVSSTPDTLGNPFSCRGTPNRAGNLFSREGTPNTLEGAFSSGDTRYNLDSSLVIPTRDGGSDLEDTDDYDTVIADRKVCGHAF